MSTLTVCYDLVSRPLLPPTASSVISLGDQSCQIHEARGLTSTLTRSTMAGVAMFMSIAGISPQAEADTYLRPLSERIEEQSRLAAFLIGYDTTKLDFHTARKLLENDHASLAFLRWLPFTVREIYGNEVVVTLQILDDPDTGEPLFEAKVHSELPLGEEFDAKDADLFAAIEHARFKDGLQRVVVTQG